MVGAINKGRWCLRLCASCLLGAMLGGCGDVVDRAEIDLNDVATNEEIDRVAGPQAGSGSDFLFGFDLRNSSHEDARQYRPLLDYLHSRTGYRFRLHFSKDAAELLEDLVSGHLQFAAIGAGTYLTARSDAAIQPLVRGVNAQGEQGYRSVIVVAPGSRLSGLSDLRGKRVAFGGRTSTQGHWIPRIMFEQAGMRLEDFGEYLYTGSHRDCAEAVITYQADACGLQDTLANRLIASGALRALAVSEVFPSSGIFASSGVPLEVREAVTEALVAFDPQGRDRDGLYHWERTEMAGGFAPASVADYAGLKARAAHLGLLPKVSPPVAAP